MTPESPMPLQATRRSPVSRMLQQAGARFVDIDGCILAERFGGDIGGETETARRLGLADLSNWPRTGFKGTATAQWLGTQGLSLPDAPNLATGGTPRVARLSRDEHLLLDPTHASPSASPSLAVRQAHAAARPQRCYHLPREDSYYWFVVTGARAPEMLAKLCAVDMALGNFANGTVAQTSVARASAIVIRHDLGSTPAFDMLGDSAMGGYMWACLLDAMDEWDAGPVGWSAVTALAAS